MRIARIIVSLQFAAIAAAQSVVPSIITQYTTDLHAQYGFASRLDTVYGIRENRYIYAADLKKKVVVFEYDVHTYVYNDIRLAGNRLIVRGADGITYELNAFTGELMGKQRSGAVLPVSAQATNKTTYDYAQRHIIPRLTVNGRKSPFLYERTGLFYVARAGTDEKLCFIRSTNERRITPYMLSIEGTNDHRTNTYTDSLAVTWQIRDTNDVTPTAYQLEFSTDSNFIARYYDTGKIDGADGTQVKALFTNGMYFARVRVWNADDMAGDFSPTAVLTVKKPGQTNTSESSVTNVVPPSSSAARDTIAPQVNITGVTNGGYYTPGLKPFVLVADDNLVSSTIELDGKSYRSQTPIIAEGVHTIYASGIDAAGNKNSRTVTFICDGSSPSITVSGVVNGGVYNTSVLPVVAIADVNLAYKSVTMNGAPLAGALSAERSYSLLAAAEDKAGNASFAQVDFTIDRTLPVVFVDGVVDGGKYTRAEIRVRVYEENFDANRSAIYLTPAPSPCITHGEGCPSKCITHGEGCPSKCEGGVRFVTTADKEGVTCYLLDIGSITNKGSYAMVYSVTDKAGNAVSNSIRFAIESFNTAESLSFYANYDTNTYASFAKGDKRDYSGVRIVVKDGFISNCVAPGVASGDVVVQYKAKDNISAVKGTLAVWLKPAWSVPTTNYIFSLYDSAYKTAALSAFVSKNGTVFSVSASTPLGEQKHSISSASNWWINTDDPRAEPRGWSQLTFTWDHEAPPANGNGNNSAAMIAAPPTVPTGAFCIYVNGLPVTNGILYGEALKNMHEFCLAAGIVNNAWKSFVGKMDEVRVYEKALSASDVKALYESERARVTGIAAAKGVQSASMAARSAASEIVSEVREGKE